MDVMECIDARRSVRDYEDKLVEHEKVDKLLHAAVMAPSAMNSQPWHLSIVEGRDKVHQFGELAFKNWNLLGLGLKLGYTLSGAKSIFYNAPLLIIISGRKGYQFLKDDTGLAVQNMFLAAHAMGLGSCWIGFAMPLENDPAAKKELGIPDSHEIVAPLIFGYPKKQNMKVPKREPKILKWIR